jgi:hypothetical protein
MRPPINRAELIKLAKSLTRVNPNFLQKTNDENIYWFFDGVANELYYNLDKKGVVVKFHMTFMLNYLEGGRYLALRTALVDEGQKNSIALKESNLIRFNPKINTETLAQGQLIVEQIESLPTEHASMILNLILQSQPSA